MYLIVFKCTKRNTVLLTTDYRLLTDHHYKSRTKTGLAPYIQHIILRFRLRSNRNLFYPSVPHNNIKRATSTNNDAQILLH